MFRYFAWLGSAGILLAASGCCTVGGRLTAVTPQQKSGPHPIEEFQYMSNRANIRNVNLDLDMLGEASRYYVYALMASNTYDRDETSPKYRIPGWRVIERVESESGLAIDLWEGDGSDGERSLVVAIEGTNNAPWEQLKRDWSNNFAWGEGAQYREAYEYVKALQERRREVKRIRAVGHSLGGGIALNLSLRLPRVDAAVFNASPRAFTQVRERQPGADRVHFSENGEFLSLISRPWFRFKFWQAGYVQREYVGNKNNFMDFRFHKLSAVKEHSMYRLSRGLLLMAVSNRDGGAREVFELNVGQVIDDNALEALDDVVKETERSKL